MTARPNVVLITADQWRGDCLSAAGHEVVRTPTLDALAATGARFSNAYSATPTCVPARVSLMTGLAHESHGRIAYEDGLPFDHPQTLAEQFGKGGYQTHAIGKLHVWPERARIGFDDVELHDGYLGYSRRRGLSYDWFDDYLPWLRDRLGDATADYAHGLNCNSMLARPWPLAEDLHPTNWVVSRAIAWLYRRDPGVPFFLYLSLHRPHPPFDPPAWAFEQCLAAEYDEPAVGDWCALFEGDRRSDPESFAAWLPDDIQRRAHAGYYGNIAHVDAQIGRFLEALREFGHVDDMVVAFTSDHGEMLGDHGLYRKGFPYQGSVNIPFILVGDAVGRGAVVDQVTDLRDVMPTLLTAAGLPVPDDLDGRCVLPLTRKRGEPWREFLHGEHTLLGQSMQWLTDGLEKYVWLSAEGREQLFDLAADPRERVDLGNDPEHRDRLRRWRTRLVEVLRDREEGFVSGGRLVPGRPVRTVLSSPAPWGPE